MATLRSGRSLQLVVVALLCPSSLADVGLPCPEDADVMSCQAWCLGVSPATGPPFSGAFGGSRCSELGSAPKPYERPQCNCYDREHTMVHASCVSPCPPRGPPKPVVQEADAQNAETRTCPAGDPSCTAAAQNLPTRRFLLYDTKFGEGFNLQREVFPRAGWVVSQLNKVVNESCAKKKKWKGTIRCVPWTLVLPPWCRVAHWRSASTHVPWREFFHEETLKGSKVPVIEFDEYVQEVGGAIVDVAIAYTTDKTELNSGKLKDPNLEMSGGLDDFLGWAHLGECDGAPGTGRELPRHRQLENGSYSITYSGQCDGGITAGDMRCAVYKSPFPKCTVDMLRTWLRTDARSVLVKSYDYLLSPDGAELDDLGLRAAMFYSEDIRQAGDSFIKRMFGDKPYLAAHCRRTDFLRARSATTPDVTAISGKLNQVLEERGLSQVFIATDAPGDILQELQNAVRGTVVVFDLGESLGHPGKQAAAEMWVAARADFFIGTIESRFTMSIQLERAFLGKPTETSSMEFCKEFPETKPCMAPKYRHQTQPSPTRQVYMR
mmetsp:Transcript_28739/g.52360  ORF Transcript_28739/g.52360 Transcript_28739/m.52360 type:complete len:549 (+) Transcript_28739:28-1674(+)